jgi:hypothetical protein
MSLAVMLSAATRTHLKNIDKIHSMFSHSEFKNGFLDDLDE